jgi:hypothetical protein
MTTTRNSRSLSTRRSRRLLSGIGVVGAAAALSVSGAGVASAAQYTSVPLSPSQGACTPAQYASFQVRGGGTATADGAKFKLLRNGVVIANTPYRVNGWAIELRSSWGNFPGPGYYSVCAQNTGSTNTIASLELRTDYEF